MEGDTIAAIATAAGVGGVGIVRLSGPAAIAIVEAIAGTSVDRQVRLAWARDKAGRRIDQVLVFGMKAPNSFTGEDVAEIHGHGGVQNLRRLLAAVLELGARVAEPGEFTRRAVCNGKLDLVRAEALLDVIHAGSERALRLAQHNLGGGLGKVAEKLEQRALGVLGEIEGRIDFPEEDLAPEREAEVDNPGSAGVRSTPDQGVRSWIDRELASIAATCASLADGFRHGHAIQSGITVALVGAVNVGKSSLFNALLGTERALVAAAPGTTRDYLEGHTVWDGVSVVVIDTAGIRETTDQIEARGIELGEQRVRHADVVVVVNDGVAPWNDGAGFGDRALVVRSKSDLGGETRGALATSAATGGGLDDLIQRVLALAGVASQEGSEDAVVTTTRQHRLAVAARDGMTAALEARRGGQVPEVVALELRAAAAALAELRGNEVGDRVLDEVFSRFCIGK